MGGIFIGKCSPETMGKVPTFCIDSYSLKYYYLATRDVAYEMNTTKVKNSESSMKHAAPVILAFWSNKNESINPNFDIKYSYYLFSYTCRHCS